MEGKEWVWSNGLLQEQEVAEMKEEIERQVRSRTANYKRCFRKIPQKIIMTKYITRGILFN